MFIDAGKQAIDAYEAIFSGITIFSNPDAADDFPEQPYPVVVHPDNTLYAVDCSYLDTGEQMSCEAKTQKFFRISWPSKGGTRRPRRWAG